MNTSLSTARLYFRRCLSSHWIWLLRTSLADTNKKSSHTSKTTGFGPRVSTSFTADCLDEVWTSLSQSRRKDQAMPLVELWLFGQTQLGCSSVDMWMCNYMLYIDTQGSINVNVVAVSNRVLLWVCSVDKYNIYTYTVQTYRICR